MKVKIEIDTKTFIRFLLVVSGFVGAIFLLWHLLPVLSILVVSFFLALALNAPVSGLARSLPGHSRVVASALSYIIVLAMLGGFIFFVAPPVIRQTSAFIDSLPSYIEQVSSEKSVIADLIHQYNLQNEIDQVVDGARHQTATIAQGVGSNVVAGVSSVITGFFTTVTILVITFFMLIEGPQWFERLWSVYNNKTLLRRHQLLLKRMYRVVTGYVNGQLLIACISGTAASVVLLILASFFTLPLTAILPLGLIVLITTLIPMIGATLGAVIVTLVLLLNDVGAALVFLIYFLIYQQIENNIIHPTVQSRTVDLSALTVLVAVITGVLLMGLIGGLLAVPVAGCLRVLFVDYIEHRKGSANVGRDKKAATVGRAAVKA